MSSAARGRGRGDGGASRGGAFPPVRGGRGHPQRGRGQAPRGACFKCGKIGHIARDCRIGNQPGPDSRGAVNNRGTVQRGRGAAPQPRAAPQQAATPQPAAADIGTPVEHDQAEDSDGGVSSASATSRPPITWRPKVQEVEIRQQERDFFDYYKKKGWGILGDDYATGPDMRLRPTAHHPQYPCNGETYFVSRPEQIGGFGSDLYEEEFSVYTGTMDQLPEIEAERKKELEKAKAELQDAEKQAKGADKDRKVRGLRAQIRRLEAPLEVFMPSLREDHESNNFVDTRTTEFPKDIAANNAPRDTMHKFKPIIKRMELAGAFGKETVMEDGKEVTVNRKWKEGDVWRPKSENPDKEALSDEELTSTFHGFIPRHHRPGRIGLGQLGYDYVYERSRDGKNYTSKDLPDRQWNTSRTAPLKFVSDDGDTFTVDVQPKPGNVAFGTKPVNVRPLRQILKENELANAKKGAYQGRSKWGVPSAHGPAGPSDQNWN